MTPPPTTLLIHRLDVLQHLPEDTEVLSEVFDIVDHITGKVGGVQVLIERYVDSPSAGMLRALSWALARAAHHPNVDSVPLVFELLEPHFQREDPSFQINCLTTLQRQWLAGLPWIPRYEPPRIVMPFLQECLRGPLPVQMTCLELVVLLSRSGDLAQLGSAAALGRLKALLIELQARSIPALEPLLEPLSPVLGTGSGR